MTRHHLLRNSLYLGDISHKGQIYPGQHQAIVSRELFVAVQRALVDRSATPMTQPAVGDGIAATETTPGGSAAPAALTIPAERARLQVIRRSCHNQVIGVTAPLIGILRDGDGVKMSPVSARKRGGAIYRYYVSQSLLTGPRKSAGAGHRLNAQQLECQILAILGRLGLVPDSLAADSTAKSAASDWIWARTILRQVTVEAGNRLRLTLVIPPQIFSVIADPTALRLRLGKSVDLRIHREEHDPAVVSARLTPMSRVILSRSP